MMQNDARQGAKMPKNNKLAVQKATGKRVRSPFQNVGSSLPMHARTRTRRVDIHRSVAGRRALRSRVSVLLWG